MSVATRARFDRRIADAGVALLSAVLIVWTIVPLYNMVRVALQEKEDVFSSSVFPTNASLTVNIQHGATSWREWKSSTRFPNHLPDRTKWPRSELKLPKPPYDLFRHRSRFRLPMPQPK